MDREYLVSQLMKIAKQNGVDIDAEVLGMIVNKSIFRVVAKGGILQNVGEETKTAALVLNGICRAYYVDGDGNDITRGFSIPGTLCMQVHRKTEKTNHLSVICGSNKGTISKSFFRFLQ